MDEEFESFIIDPDLVDPGFDVSGLRTTTDTRPELLFDLPEFSGIRVDPTRRSYIEDMYRAYAGQIPMLDVETPAAAPPATGGGGSGDGGQATAPITGDSTATPIIPIEPGTFTAESLDESFAGEEGPITQPVTGGITSDPIEMENIMTYENPYDEPMDFDNPAASIENILQPNTPGTIGGPVDVFDINETGDPSQNSVSTNVGDQPMAAGPFDYLQQPSIPGLTQADITQGKIDEERLPDYTPSFETQEQESAVQNILGKAGQTVQGALTELGKIPGAVVDFAEETVDVFGKKLNVGKTLASLAFNAAVGAPVSLVFGLAEDILPSGISTTTNKAREVGLLVGDGTVTQDKYGINTQSAFGDYDQYNLDRVEFLENKTNKTPRDEQELIERKNYIKSTGADGDIDERDQMLEDIVTQNKIDEGIQAADDDKDDDMLDTFDTTPADTTNIFDEVALTGGGFDTTPVDEFSDEAFMVGDTSTAAPTTGDSGADSFFDAVDNSVTGTTKPGTPTSTSSGPNYGPPSQSSPTSSGPNYGPPSQSSSGGNGGSSSGGGGCVIATHAVNSGAFTKDTKREAVRWCVKNLHRTWWGEAIRRGYRYYGQKAIEEGKAKNHYQEFKDYVAFGTGKRRTLKTGWTFVYRSIQFFIRGLING